MSFYSNFQSDKTPCKINGNPVAGLNEKVCIQAQKIFDACIKQSQLQNLSLSLSDFKPSNPAFPLTFVSARSTTGTGTVTALSVDRLADKSGCGRVQATVTIPIEVTYTDANGVEGFATSSITVNQDVLMSIPAPSLFPYTVAASVSSVSPEGRWDTTAETFFISACVTVILKIAIDVELLIPTYGYCAIPPAQEYSQEVCAGFFELPLYPQSGTGPCK